MPAIQVTNRIFIDESELDESFIASSGPGGQNVNKVATACQLRFDVAHSPAFNDHVRSRLMALSGSRLTLDGVIVITARQFRTQERNRADARERLFALIREAAIVPIARRATKPTLASKKRRLDEKSNRASIKKGRGKPSFD
ncbi:alternative ribosome rescue aminoacyl-tRNA hydrolase ArfB [Lacibacterium aquatile]|uniref:Alternative ribosome rescue aminoacyl-tRNA hydrolase ArfB n=2 Tax=Lacibacterium aquatile TaxID=1168082 RepID=A0ABW5DV97_9PROT